MMRDDCGFLMTRTGLRIGAKWRDSQQTAATPRTRGDVEFLGVHGEHLQRALLHRPGPNRIADVLLATVIGIALACAAVHWWSS